MFCGLRMHFWAKGFRFLGLYGPCKTGHAMCWLRQKGTTVGFAYTGFFLCFNRCIGPYYVLELGSLQNFISELGRMREVH